MPVLDHSMPAHIEESELILAGIAEISWQLTKINRGLARLFAIPPDREPALSFAQLISPSDWPKCLEAQKECIAQPGRPVSRITRCQVTNGRVIQIHWEFTATLSHGQFDILITGILLNEGTAIQNHSPSASYPGRVNHGMEMPANLHDLPVGVLLYHRESGLAGGNTEAEKILGAAPGTFNRLASLDAGWQCIHEDGRTFPGNTHPAILALHTGQIQSGVIMGLRKAAEPFTWICMYVQPVYDNAEQGLPAAVLCYFTDITKHKQTEDALRSNESRWKFALDGSGEGVWEYDLEKGTIYFSKQYKRVMGYEEEEWEDTVDSWRSRIHPDDRPLVESIDRKYASGAIRNHTAEYRMRHKAGHYIWVSDRGMIIEPSGADRSAKLIGTHSDISQRKQAELALAQSVEQFRSLSRNLPGAVYEYVFYPDGSSAFSYVSDSIEKLFGISPEEFASSYDFIHPDDLPLLLERNRHSRETNEPFYFEGRILTPDGKVKWHIASSFFSYRQDDGSRVFTGIIIDNTERKRGEQLLRESEMRFRAIFNSMFQFIGLLEPDGTLIEANQTALEFGDVDASDVINRPIWDTYWWNVDERTRAELKAAVRKAAKGEFVRYEVEIFGPGRKLTLIDFTIKPVRNERGEVILLIPEGRDISDQRKAESELMKTTEKLSTFLENAPTMNWIIDEEGRFRYMNDLYMKAHGLTEKDRQCTIYDIFPQDLARSYMINNRRVIDSNMPLETIEEGIRSDGMRTVLQVYKFPIPSESGERLLGGNALDITELTVNNEALEKSNERFHYVSKATSDAIWDWDVRENRLFRGNGFAHLFGESETETHIEYKLGRIHPDDKELVMESLETAMYGSQNRWQAEYRFLCADNQYKTVIDKGYIIRGEDGMAIRFIGAMQDITEQRRLEQQLRNEQEKQKHAIMEAVIKAQEREREEISYELHDNVNQILSSGKLFLEIAVRNYDENPKLYINKGKESIQLAIDEIRKISHGLNSSSIGLVGLSGALKDLADQINLSGRMKIYFTHSEPADSNPVHRDIDLALFRIAQEQLNNIIKHSRATEARFMLAYPGERISLLIADNGIGFDPKMTRKGLGLNNILNRTEHYGGRSELITSPGNGCILKVSFPRHMER